MLVGRSVILLLSLAIPQACEEQAPRPEREPEPPSATRAKGPTSQLKRELEELASEAGIEAPVDPPPPNGDLKNDIESFTTLDACVRARATNDAVLGDAIEALGYDTLTRDACRILQAMKAKNGDACKPIASSALRSACESSVAVLTGDPSRCPVAGGDGRFATRDPVCLARASRDERLCAATHATDRAKCRALVLGRATECGRDESCVRQVERYKSLLEKPANHPPVAAHLHVELVAEGGSPEPTTKSLDLDEVAAAGAVVQANAEKVRVSLGAPKNGLWPASDAPLASPWIFVEVSLPARAAAGPVPHEKKSGAPVSSSLELGTNDLRLDLLVPKVALLSALTADGATLEVRQLSLEPGGAIRFVLSGTVREAPRAFRVKLDVETFVRERSGRAGTDVASPQP